MRRPFLVHRSSDNRPSPGEKKTGGVHEIYPYCRRASGRPPGCGKVIYGKEAGGDLEYVERVIGICQEEQDRSSSDCGRSVHRQPLLRELKEADYLFSTLTHTKVVLIAGNHDYIRRDSYYRTFRWHDNVYPLLTGRSAAWNLTGWRLPFTVSAITAERSRNRCITARRRKEDSGMRFYWLTAGTTDIFRSTGRTGPLRFSYTALGAYSQTSGCAQNRIVYAGALEPVDRNDTGPHGYVKGELTEKGIHISWIPCASGNISIWRSRWMKQILPAV